MATYSRVFILSFAIAALLLLSAVGTTTVYADDETPPPTSETSEGESESDDTEVVSEEQQPAGGEATPILEQLPENTSLIVVNAEGTAEPLVSQASAEAILLSDPIWCPNGQSPTPGANGCTTSYSSFTELLNFLKANEGDVAYQQAGTIYVQKDVYAGGESSIDFNPYNFTNFNQHDLTVHGGWDTVDNSLDTTDTSQLSVPIVIGTSLNPWGGSLTFNNIWISNVSNQTALTLYSQTDITLSNVEITNSDTGADLHAGQDVAIDDSKFDNNKKANALVNAGGNVRISNSTFNNSQGKGLEVNNGGSVSLANVEANNNGLFGADILATGGVAISNSFFNGNTSANVVACPPGGGGGGGDDDDDKHKDDDDKEKEDDDDKHKDDDDKEKEDDDDRHKDDERSRNVSRLTDDHPSSDDDKNKDDDDQHKDDDDKHKDDDDKEKEDDDDDGGQTSCPGAATFLGYGLQVVTTSSIALSNVQASNNNLFGAHLVGSDIAISDSIFSNNGTGTGNQPLGKGLEVKSTGAVSLFNVEANNNQLFGADIQAVGGVSVSNSFFNGNASANVVACPPGGGGGGGDDDDDKHKDDDDKSKEDDDDRHKDDERSRNVSRLTDDNPSSDDDKNKDDDNQHKDDDDKHKDDDDKEKEDDDDDGGQTSCQGGATTFFGYGLQVVTTGIVSLNTVQASNNNLFGAHLVGSDIAISDSIFSNNGSGTGNQPLGKGLEVKSTGAVSLFNVEANNNQLFGADILATGGVAISNSFFNGNTSANVVACPPGGGGGGGDDDDDKHKDDDDKSKEDDDDRHKDDERSRNVSRLTDDHPSSDDDKNKDDDDQHKDDDDKHKDDDDKEKEDDDDGGQTSCPGAATFLGYGLQVVTTGLVSIDNVTAAGNGTNGVIISSPANITVTNSTLDSNGKDSQSSGLVITTTSGQVTLDNVTATNNGLNGVDVTGNCTTVFVVNGTYSNNAQYGLKIVNAALNQTGAPVFAGNGAGNIFEDPGACPPLTTLSVTSVNNINSVNNASSTFNTNEPVISSHKSKPSNSKAVFYKRSGRYHKVFGLLRRHFR